MSYYKLANAEQAMQIVVYIYIALTGVLLLLLVIMLHAINFHIAVHHGMEAIY